MISNAASAMLLCPCNRCDTSRLFICQSCNLLNVTSITRQFGTSKRSGKERSITPSQVVRSLCVTVIAIELFGQVSASWCVVLDATDISIAPAFQAGDHRGKFFRVRGIGLGLQAGLWCVVGEERCSNVVDCQAPGILVL
jgi:hypothetical protein